MSAYNPEPVFDLFEDCATGVVQYPKPGGRRPVRMRVLVVVKAAPNPSRQYRDTVCVAGIRVDRRPYTWVRLYPIPFRHMTYQQRFKKYELLELDATPAQEDARAESYRPSLESIQHLEQIPATQAGWKTRFDYLRPLDQGLNTCDLIQGWRNKTQQASLAIIDPRRIRRVAVDDHEGWTKSQLQAMRVFDDSPSLFDQDSTSHVRPLEAPRFHVKVDYDCKAPSCRGHNSSLIDWEASALDRSLSRDEREEARMKIAHKYENTVLAERREPRLIIGNMARYPRSYSILGAYPTSI